MQIRPLTQNLGAEISGDGEGRALIDELNALAIHPDLTYEHRRVIRRCTVLGEVPA